MWILDSAGRDGIDLWYREGSVKCRHYDYDPPFFLHLPDPAAHHEMIDALRERQGAEPCTFRTLSGDLSGFSVHGGRAIAEAIEQQTCGEARLFNVDVRRDQRFMAEQGIFPCGKPGESRYSPDLSYELRTVEIQIRDNPVRSPVCTDVRLVHERPEVLQGDGRTVTEDLFSLVEAIDPDVILMSQADLWMPRLRQFAFRCGLALPFSRTGKYRRMDSRSYWSYGRVEHKDAALIPDGRVLIDTDQSFVYREGGLDGVFMAARLSGISPSLASRFTPGTLISSYEVYEALRRGIAVPFRKSDIEKIRRFSTLHEADRGGMMFQPVAGVYGDVDEIDFTSMYPSIIVNFNLSPESLSPDAQAGFLADVLRPVVMLRCETKQKKKCDPRYAGTDSLLKWMLVTCFGYTGYKNAKFGRIEVHEAITRKSREILIQTKEIAESRGFSVLHGIVDCLWVQGSGVEGLLREINCRTGLSAECEHFDWIVFLPLNDGSGAYNRYYGRLSDGSIKVRGIAARRHDAPEYIRTMQQEMLTQMAHASTPQELARVRDTVYRVYCNAVRDLSSAPVSSLAISRRISRTTYAHRCMEGAAVQAFRDAGIAIAPGMKIRYVVRDARRYGVDPEWTAERFDPAYYRELLDRAWREISFAFRWDGRDSCGSWTAQKELAAGGNFPLQEEGVPASGSRD